MRLRGREGFPDCDMFEAEHLTCSRIWSSTGYLTALAGHLCGKFNSAARQARMVHLWKALSFLLSGAGYGLKVTKRQRTWKG